MGPLISIVVPAYNRECLIGPTLASIIAQDYDNLEIIVVDDASSDKTAEVSRNMLESSHMQWRVISHDVNKGVGAARNTGMGEANGEYILFMDSDDLADPDFISTLYGLAKDGRDVTFCGYRIWNAERRGEERRGEESPITLDPFNEYSGEDLTLKLMMGTFWTGVWTMLFRRDFLLSEGLRFTEGAIFGEDYEFFMKALAKSRKTAFSKKCLYVYVQHDQMFIRTSMATKEKRLARYSDFTAANLRISRFMAENVKSPENLKAVRHLLLPRHQLKMLKLYAWINDYETFDREIRSPEIRSVLWSSWRGFFKEPQNFLKSLLLMAAPKLWFEIRRRSSRFK